MKALKSAAATRLIKKLSALRVTLPNEERKLLDALITVEGVKTIEPKRAIKTATKEVKPQIHFDRKREEYRPVDD